MRKPWVSQEGNLNRRMCERSKHAENKMLPLACTEHKCILEGVRVSFSPAISFSSLYSESVFPSLFLHFVSRAKCRDRETHSDTKENMRTQPICTCTPYHMRLYFIYIYIYIYIYTSHFYFHMLYCRLLSIFFFPLFHV